MPPRWLPLGVLLGGGVVVLVWATGPFHRMALAAWLLFLYLPASLLALSCLEKVRGARHWGWPLLPVALLGWVTVQAFVVEPHWLEISRHRLEIPGLADPLTVVVLADVQTDRVGAYEREVFEQVRALAPDLVLLPGDYLQLGGEPREGQLAPFRALFDGLAPPLGMWAVGGNVDPPGWPALFEGTGVQALEGQDTVRLREDLWLTGLSLKASFDPSLALPGVPQGVHIVLGHAPDFALGPAGGDLLVAGHTHGGQVRIPGLGPIITLSRVPRAWAAGVTALPDGRTLVVSRGIGMERGRAPRLRFFCRPELVVLDLVPSTGNEPR